MLETPRLRGDKATLEENEKLCREFLQSLDADPNIEPFEDEKNAFIWRNVPKNYVIELVRSFITHPWNLNFQPIALADYISEDDGSLDKWDVAIPKGSAAEWTQQLDLIDKTIAVVPESRGIEWDAATKNLLRVNGHHVRVGAGGCSKIGLPEETIKNLREAAKAKKEKVNDKTYLIKERNPLLLIHIIYNSTGPEERKPDDPDIIFALGLGFPDDGKNRKARYMVNVQELKNWVDITDEDDDDDDD